MDSYLTQNNRKRCSSGKFILWVLPWFGLLFFGVFCAFLCLLFGLNQTNMSDIFAFGLWIVLDLAVIALGAGAFFSGFLTYIIGKNELKDIINAAVVIGFICYSAAGPMIAIDVGQPVRMWFIFWHANIHSMLVEVSFCITCYLGVLLIEYIPIIIQNKNLNSIKALRLFGDNLHHLVAIFAGTGVFLSFFHQGSLGGMWGVLYGRPFAARDGFYVWPWTFFLFIFSAIAAGPCFTIICTRLTEFISGKKLVSEKAIQTLAKISGFTLSGYLIFRIADIIGWNYGIVPDAGQRFTDFFREGPYGIWLLVCEIILFGIVPAMILTIPKTRKNGAWLIIGCIMNCTGVVLNRFIYVIVTLAIPVMPFDKFWSYLPTWQEWGIALGLVGYGFLIFSFSYRYLPLFPERLSENELNRMTNNLRL